MCMVHAVVIVIEMALQVLHYCLHMDKILIQKIKLSQVHGTNK